MKNSTKGCWDCARKHLGEAIAWFQESQLGHPDHFWAGVGALSHAERETLPLSADAAGAIRKARHGCYSGEIPDVIRLIGIVNKACGTPYGSASCGCMGCGIGQGQGRGKENRLRRIITRRGSLSPLRNKPDYGEREEL